MEYESKRKYELELTEAQALWLWSMLTRGLDAFFENNPRERKLCDNIAEQLKKVMEIKY